MKKRLAVFCALMFSAAGGLMADVNVVVTNVPQKVFVEKIGGKHVNVEAMVPPGADPHSYSPRPSQMKAISKADIYFSIGLDFEDAWLPKFIAQNKKMHVEKMYEGVERIEFGEEDHEMHHDDHAHDDHKHEEEKHDDHKHDAHKHDDHKDEHAEHKHDEHDHESHKDEHAGHGHDHEGPDPHVWMSPAAVKVMAKNIVHELEHLDPENAKTFERNYEAFLKEIEETDHEIKEALEHVDKGTPFMVFHPAYGYFAHQYGLKQWSIEFEGKEPKPKMLAHMIEEAKEKKIKTIITSPEFSDSSAKVLAKEIGGSVVKISPLAENWSENLISLAKTIAKDNTHDHHKGHTH